MYKQFNHHIFRDRIRQIDETEEHRRAVELGRLSASDLSRLEAYDRRIIRLELTCMRFDPHNHFTLYCFMRFDGRAVRKPAELNDTLYTLQVYDAERVRRFECLMHVLGIEPRLRMNERRPEYSDVEEYAAMLLAEDLGLTDLKNHAICA